MAQRTIDVAIATNGSGAYSKTVNVDGDLHAISVNVGTITGGTLTITDVHSGAVLFTDTPATGQFHPRVPAHDGSGDELSGAYTAPVATGQITVAITGGGASKQGTVRLVVDK